MARELIDQLADTFETYAAVGKAHLRKSYDLPQASAGAFHHARAACEYFATVEAIGASYKCCGELELSVASRGLSDAREQLNTCAFAQTNEGVKKGLNIHPDF